MRGLFRMGGILLSAYIAANAATADAALPPDFLALAKSIATPDTAPQSLAAARAMIAVPAGSYPLGRGGACHDQSPAHQVTVEKFRIDKTEVTNAAFAEYLTALRLPVTGSAGVAEIGKANASKPTLDLLQEGGEGSGLYPIIALDDEQSRIVLRDGIFVAAEGYEDHPVAETTWAGARAYCVWRGGDLPTEAQWEAAARGTDNRLYPWGDAAPSDATASVSGRSGVTGAVGKRPAGASPFGALDMAGSMAEWTLSLKRPYPYAENDGRNDATRAGERVTRGGDYMYDRNPGTMTVSHRNGFSNAPERGHRHIGFRCAEA